MHFALCYEYPGAGPGLRGLENEAYLTTGRMRMPYYNRSGNERRNGDRRSAYNYANSAAYANYAQYAGPERRNSDRRSGKDRRDSY
jgi:hypothetical protein